MEDDRALGDQSADQAPPEAPPEAPQAPPEAPQATDGPKHYMFFSSLKMIKEKAEAILAMDASKVDALLADGHDWASDHISTSRDDVEEVYNWLAGEMGADQAVQQAGGQ